jgi:hypothetical protein
MVGRKWERQEGGEGRRKKSRSYTPKRQLIFNGLHIAIFQKTGLSIMFQYICRKDNIRYKKELHNEQGRTIRR